MSYRSINCANVLAFFAWLILCPIGVSAQASLPVSTQSPPRSEVVVSDSSLEKRLDELEQQFKELKKPPKDRWDKLGAISGLLSGSVVALLGLLITYILSERNRTGSEQQKERELAISDQQKQRELAILQVQTVQGFMPQLQSGGPREVEAALLAIFALDKNSPLATDLAGLYRTEGAISALRKIASGSDREPARRAQQTLADMITVSLKRFSPDLEDLSLPINSLPTFRDLTNQVFWGLKGGVDAFTYEEVWILRNKNNGDVFNKMRTTEGDIARIDTRSLDEIGIRPGMTLEAIPIEGSQMASPR